MKLLFIMLLGLFGCYNIETESKYVTEYRWVDVNDLIDLVNISSGKNNQNEILNSNDVLNILGEPVYIEQYNINNQSQTLLWYNYKSKLYPVKKKKTIDKSLSSNTETVYINKQIKPEKIANFNLWETNSEWLLVSLNNKSHEIILIDKEKSYTPQYFRNLDFEKLKDNETIVFPFISND